VRVTWEGFGISNVEAAIGRRLLPYLKLAVNG